MKIHLNPDALTFGDLEDFETYVGTPLMDTFDKVGAGGIGSISGKALVALVWICGRGENPDMTLDEARKAKLTDLEVEVGTEDPTPAAD